jgi:redox-sensitive bicupin YhaK (pirin superfamily)
MAKGDREVIQVVTPRRVLEGAGVRLHRSFPGPALDYLDPFLLLDDFSSDNPDDVRAGFPMHPHRGIETVTYMLAGSVNHRDSLDNAGTIGAGDVQWMTAGSGILHEEMPHPIDNRMAGFQLWVNLPAALKMGDPRYQEVAADRIPLAKTPEGALIRVIAGEVIGVRGPVTEIAAQPLYLDVQLPPRTDIRHPIAEEHTACAYLFDGGASFGTVPVPAPTLVVLGPGNVVAVHSGDAGARYLLLAGRPLGEPVARYGPFVMNTAEEIEQALEDLRQGTFIRARPPR